MYPANHLCLHQRFPILQRRIQHLQITIQEEKCPALDVLPCSFPHAVRRPLWHAEKWRVTRCTSFGLENSLSGPLDHSFLGRDWYRVVLFTQQVSAGNVSPGRILLFREEGWPRMMSQLAGQRALLFFGQVVVKYLFWIFGPEVVTLRMAIASA